MPSVETSGMPQRRDQRPSASLDPICAKHARQAQEWLSSTFHSSSSALAVFVSHQLFLLSSRIRKPHRLFPRSEIWSKKKKKKTCEFIVLKPNFSNVLNSPLNLCRLIDLPGCFPTDGQTKQHLCPTLLWTMRYYCLGFVWREPANCVTLISQAVFIQVHHNALRSS